MSENFGMMEGMYFVGRRELLQWVNGFLQLDPEYTKIEQMASATAYCQFMDALFPGRVPVTKVKFQAKTPYDFTNNWKILQKLFNQLKISRHIDIPALTKAKYQDNLEFLQWFKRFFDSRWPEDGEYDPVARRKVGRIPSRRKSIAPRGMIKENLKPHQDRRMSVAPRASVRRSQPTARAARMRNRSVRRTPEIDTFTSTEKKKSTHTSKEVVEASTSSQHGTNVNVTNESTSEVVTPDETTMDPLIRIESMDKSISYLRRVVQTLVKERQFYYDRLREIEDLCQTSEHFSTTELIQDVQQILSSSPS